MASIPLVEPAFQKIWSIGVIITWVSTVSYGCIAMQACAYFRKFFHRDHYILKFTVACIWFCCTSLVASESWVTHEIIVVGYFLPSGLVTISLGVPIALAVGLAIICAVQGVYVFRMYRFDHNRYLLACCCALAGVELGTGSTWVARMAHTVPAWQDIVVDERAGWIITTFFATSASLDMLIAVSTCYQLWRSRAMGLKKTRHLVDKLMRWTIQTGVFTSVVSLVIILVRNLGKNDDSSLWLTLAILAPNCYAVGLLALLNARTSLKLGTDHLSMPTATISLAHIGTSRSTESHATTDSTHGVVYDSGLSRATTKPGRGDPPSP